MNNDLRRVVSKYKLPVNKLTIKSGAKIIDNKIVIKNKKNDNLDRTYGYLKSRSFDYFPYPISIENDYEVYPYIEDDYEPREQKAMDMMHLLLHCLLVHIKSMKN